MRVKNSTVLVIPSVNLEEVRTKILHGGFIIVRPIAKGCDAENKCINYHTSVRSIHVLFFDFKTPLQFGFQKIGLVFKNINKCKSAMNDTHWEIVRGARSWEGHSNIFVWRVVKNRQFDSYEDPLPNTGRRVVAMHWIRRQRWVTANAPDQRHWRGQQKLLRLHHRSMVPMYVFAHEHHRRQKGAM